MKDRLSGGWLRWLAILGAVLLTATVWWFFIAWSSRTNDAAAAKPGVVTFSNYFRSNPYCLVDPTCVNPLANSNGVNVGFARSEFAGGRTLGRLAWVPNYFIFLTSLASAAAAASRFLKAGSSVRALLMTILISWNVLEHARWFLAVAASLHSSTQGIAVPLGFLVLALISTAAIVGVARFVSRDRRTVSGHKALRV